MSRGRCPTCRGTSVKDGNKLWPFCSTRCHLIDLGRWLGEEYRMPEEPDARGGGAEPSEPGSRDE